MLSSWHEQDARAMEKDGFFVTRRPNRAAAWAMALLATAGGGLVCFCAAGCAPAPDQSRFADPAHDLQLPSRIVQVRCAKIPWTCAVHCWFADYEPSGHRWHRWEVWQTAGGGEGDWGHVRRDLMPPRAGVGAGESWSLAEFAGEEANRIHAVLAAPLDYPYRDPYQYWPGPNSNTYVAWILRKSGVKCDLPMGAIGKDY